MKARGAGAGGLLPKPASRSGANVWDLDERARLLDQQPQPHDLGERPDEGRRTDGALGYGARFHPCNCVDGWLRGVRSRSGSPGRRMLATCTATRAQARRTSTSRCLWTAMRSVSSSRGISPRPASGPTSPGTASAWRSRVGSSDSARRPALYISRVAARFRSRSTRRSEGSASDSRASRIAGKLVNTPPSPRTGGDAASLVVADEGEMTLAVAVKGAIHDSRRMRARTRFPPSRRTTIDSYVVFVNTSIATGTAPRRRVFGRA